MVSPPGLRAKWTWGTQLLVLIGMPTPWAIPDPTLKARMDIPEPILFAPGHPQAHLFGHPLKGAKRGVRLVKRGKEQEGILPLLKWTKVSTRSLVSNLSVWPKENLLLQI